MSDGWPTGYAEIASQGGGDSRGRAAFTQVAEDPAWDRFVEDSSQGQFQQTARWAGVKSLEGWRLARCVVSRNGLICGGGQILWRQKGPLRLGYVTKGPVVADQEPDAAESVMDGVMAVARRMGLAVLLAQPPDSSSGLTALFARRGFHQEVMMQVVGATLLVDLTGGMRAVEARMRQRELRKTRQALRRGVVVREGNRADLAKFFELMCLTCERQGGVRPNPGSVHAFETIWDHFQPHGCRLTLAESDGGVVAGLFCLTVGKRITFWKKGGTAGALALQPMPLLYHESMAWAADRGFTVVDFAGLRSDIAATLLQGGELSEEQTRSRDFFNLGYGGSPVVLPPPMIYFANPLMRLAYSSGVRIPWLRHAAKRWAS